MDLQCIGIEKFPFSWICCVSTGAEEPLTSPDENANELDEIQQAVGGDEKAFAKLMRRYQPQVFRYMWRFTRDRHEQEDLVQEVFVQLYGSLRRFRGDVSLGYWIHRIATNVGYAFWRNMKKNRHIRAGVLARMDIVTASGLPSPDRMDAETKSAVLFSLLEELPPRERLVLTLRYYEDLSNEEIALRTGWNSTLVRVIAYRARQRMKRSWEIRELRENDHERRP